MAEQRVGIIMHGVTGRMGMNQHPAGHAVHDDPYALFRHIRQLLADCRLLGLSAGA